MMESIRESAGYISQDNGIAAHDLPFVPDEVAAHDHDEGDDHDHHEGGHGDRHRGTRRRLKIEEIDFTPYEECSTMFLMICKGFTGEIIRVQVSAFDTVEESLPLIADQVNYHTPDFDKIGLYNMTRDFEYLMHETFIETGTREGDLLFMADGQACHKK